MSTRAQILITDGQDTFGFYRHSDGYPDGAMPTLKKFLDLVKTGRIRDNAMQAVGHLILIGHEEYLDMTSKPDSYMKWKVGAYEPTVSLHGDIEFLYVIDLVAKTITVHEDNFEKIYTKLTGIKVQS